MLGLRDLALRFSVLIAIVSGSDRARARPPDILPAHGPPLQLGRRIPTLGLHGRPPENRLGDVRLFSDALELQQHTRSLRHIYPADSITVPAQVLTKVYDTFSTPNGAPNGTDAAAIAGVATNADGDLRIFLSAMGVNTVICALMILCFMSCRARFPKVYSNNYLAKITPKDPGDGLFSWVDASLSTSPRDSAAWIGLDSSLLIEFCNLGMRIMLLISVPMFMIMGPMNCFFGGHAAGRDRLSIFSFGNVEAGSWLYLVHAFSVWYVVLVVVGCVFAAQRQFLERRFEWLHNMPEVRANTILIEDVPNGYRSEAALRGFFASMFSPEKIASVYFVKDTRVLEALIERSEAAGKHLRQTQRLVARGGSRSGHKHQPTMQGHASEVAATADLIRAERCRVLEASHREGDAGSNMWCAFVKFRERRDAEVALMLEYSANRGELIASIPPEPQDIRWRDLMQSPGTQEATTVIGYFCVALLYFAYLPLIVGITNAASLLRLPGPLQPFWEGLAPTLGLQLMVRLLPSVLLAIFRAFFTLRAEVFAQRRLQNWYFWFQLIFVVMVTAIGRSAFSFTAAVLQDPLSIFGILADTMPYATHFYMNFMVLQFGVHSISLTRFPNLLKFLAFRNLFEEEEARQMSEPENQEHAGIGSRSARLTIQALIGIIFGTLSPPIAVLTLLCFMLCRLVYGYLIPFAETRKPDLGGNFWVSQLEHLFIGTAIYSVMMTGVLWRRGRDHWPMIISAPSLIFVVVAYMRFQEEFCWQKLPYGQIAQRATEPKHIRTSGTVKHLEYRQPVLGPDINDADLGSSGGPKKFQAGVRHNAKGMCC